MRKIILFVFVFMTTFAKAQNSFVIVEITSPQPRKVIFKSLKDSTNLVLCSPSNNKTSRYLLSPLNYMITINDLKPNEKAFISTDKINYSEMNEYVYKVDTVFMIPLSIIITSNFTEIEK